MVGWSSLRLFRTLQNKHNDYNFMPTQQSQHRDRLDKERPMVKETSRDLYPFLIEQPQLWNAVSEFLLTLGDLLVSSAVRSMSGHGNRMKIDVSRWQWHKFKDLFHFYTMLGVIPATVVVFLTNIYIGPATLAEIPEGYTPHHWEYQKHPISRFIAKYIQSSYQQEYEKYIHYLYEEDERAKLRFVCDMVRDKMAERHDYQAYYYRPITAKYFRETRDITERTKQIIGDNWSE